MRPRLWRTRRWNLSGRTSVLFQSHPQCNGLNKAEHLTGVCVCQWLCGFNLHGPHLENQAEVRPLIHLNALTVVAHHVGRPYHRGSFDGYAGRNHVAALYDSAQADLRGRC